jgi:hypothetical protein
MKQYNMYNKKKNITNGERHYSSIIRPYSPVYYHKIQSRNYSCDPFSIIFTLFSVICIGKIGRHLSFRYSDSILKSDSIEKLTYKSLSDDFNRYVTDNQTVDFLSNNNNSLFKD